MMKIFFLLFSLVLCHFVNAMEAELISAKKIWDKPAHSAFTDLVRYQGKWLCTFREGEEHAGDDGKIRIIESDDGEDWKSIALIALPGIDLRDPKLSVTPDDRLMLLLGGIEWEKEKCRARQSMVSFSSDGINWSPLKKVIKEGEWLWRVTWHDGKAYGVAYNTHHKKEGWTTSLYESEDGKEFHLVAPLSIPGNPSETTLRFNGKGEMIALVRRGGGPKRYVWVGISQAPYTHWKWNETKLHYGGPDFVILPDGRMAACGRIIHQDKSESVILADMTLESLVKILTLPSGGDDTSYPGMVFHDGIIWISYYSSHEEKSSIYLAKVKIHVLSL